MQNERTIKRRRLGEVRRAKHAFEMRELILKPKWKKHFLDLQAGVDRDSGSESEDEDEEELIEGQYQGLYTL